MKEINVMKSINYAVRQETVAANEKKFNPDKPFFPYVKASALPQGQAFPMRLIFAHPEKNPNGVIEKVMYQFPDKLDMVAKGGFAKHVTRNFVVPTIVDESLPDPMPGIFAKIGALLDGDSDEAKRFRDVCNDKENVAFKKFLEVISKTWTQYICPVLLYATFEEYKDGNYSRYRNFEPDMDCEQYLPCLMQFNKSGKIEEALLEELKEKTVGKGKHYDPWNDPNRGQIFYFKHANADDGSFKKVYSWKGSGAKEPLDEDFANKLEANPDFYPDLVERELKKNLKVGDDLLAEFKKCPKEYIDILRDFGVLDSD